MRDGSARRARGQSLGLRTFDRRHRPGRVAPDQHPSHLGRRVAPPVPSPGVGRGRDGWHRHVGLVGRWKACRYSSWKHGRLQNCRCQGLSASAVKAGQATANHDHGDSVGERTTRFAFRIWVVQVAGELGRHFDVLVIAVHPDPLVALARYRSRNTSGSKLTFVIGRGGAQGCPALG